jgi:transposase
MLTVAKIDYHRDEFFEKGKSISEIAEDHVCYRKTLRKYINKKNRNEEIKPVTVRKSKHNLYKTIIDGWLEDDRRRRKKQRHKAQRVFNRLCEEYGEQAFSCSYRTVASYVAEKKLETRNSRIAALPLVHRVGEAQLDFGEADFSAYRRCSGTALV